MSVRMKQKAYARAGVDIDLGNKVKATLPQLLAATHRREVLGKVGGFGGLFALDLKKYREPVLVSSVDGVGTKLKIAFAMDKHDTIGADLVNHCVNDILVQGAAPLFFLDYFATGKLQPKVTAEVVRGLAPQARALVSIMADLAKELGSASFGGAALEARLKVPEVAALLRTKQDPMRILAYYKGKLVSVGMIRVS